jgi:hypothetical protein
MMIVAQQVKKPAATDFYLTSKSARLSILNIPKT